MGPAVRIANYPQDCIASLASFIKLPTVIARYRLHSKQRSHTLSISSLRKLSAIASLSAFLVLAGCHKKVDTPTTPPPPPPPAPAAPTASITADPKVIDKGTATTLSWETTNATDVTVSALGSVPVRNSRVVSPTESTTYTITAKGPGGSVEASARVTVNTPAPTLEKSLPPNLTVEQLFEQDIRDIYFGYDTYDIATAESANVQQDADFLTRYPDIKIIIAGHCDERGSVEYNLALGQSRAESLKDAFVTAGIDAKRIRIISLGKEKPFCTEEDEACYQKNRVDHLTLDIK
jgi:peptidoglycan-associated lipoprotein